MGDNMSKRELKLQITKEMGLLFADIIESERKNDIPSTNTDSPEFIAWNSKMNTFFRQYKEIISRAKEIFPKSVMDSVIEVKNEPKSFSEFSRIVSPVLSSMNLDLGFGNENDIYENYILINDENQKLKNIISYYKKHSGEIEDLKIMLDQNDRAIISGILEMSNPFKAEDARGYCAKEKELTFQRKEFYKNINVLKTLNVISSSKQGYWEIINPDFEALLEEYYSNFPK